MLDTLSASNPSISWTVNDGNGEYTMTFNYDGTGSIGSRSFHYSVGPSGNAAFPLAFVAQCPHPIMQQVYQVWTGIVNAEAGGGYVTAEWPGGQPGTLAGLTMTIIS